MKIAPIILALLSQSCFACIDGPAISRNKVLHFVGSAAISSAVTLYTKNPNYGFAAGFIAGYARERYKMNVGGDCEISSIVYDFAGTWFGSYGLDKFYLQKSRKSIMIGYKLNY